MTRCPLKARWTYRHPSGWTAVYVDVLVPCVLEAGHKEPCDPGTYAGLDEGRGLAEPGMEKGACPSSEIRLLTGSRGQDHRGIRSGLPGGESGRPSSSFLRLKEES